MTTIEVYEYTTLYGEKLGYRLIISGAGNVESTPILNFWNVLNVMRQYRGATRIYNRD